MQDDTKLTEENLGVSDQEETENTQPQTTSQPQTHQEQMQKVDEYEQQLEKIAQVAQTGEQISDSDRENLLGWKRRKTIEMLNNEPKIAILIPFQVGEDINKPANQYQFFGINGVWIQVRKGDYVDVPLSVFKLYQDSIRRPSVDESLASANLMGNIGLKLDPITGKNKSSDALHY